MCTRTKKKAPYIPEPPSKDIFLNIPDELLLMIIDYLDLDDLKTAALVCGRFHRVVQFEICKLRTFPFFLPSIYLPINLSTRYPKYSQLLTNHSERQKSQISKNMAPPRL